MPPLTATSRAETRLMPPQAAPWISVKLRYWLTPSAFQAKPVSSVPRSHSEPAQSNGATTTVISTRSQGWFRIRSCRQSRAMASPKSPA